MPRKHPICLNRSCTKTAKLPKRSLVPMFCTQQCGYSHAVGVIDDVWCPKCEEWCLRDGATRNSCDPDSDHCKED